MTGFPILLMVYRNFVEKTLSNTQSHHKKGCQLTILSFSLFFVCMYIRFLSLRSCLEMFSNF